MWTREVRREETMEMEEVIPSSQMTRINARKGAKGRIGKVPLNANGRHLCTRPIRPSLSIRDSCSLIGGGADRAGLPQ
ncbi:unnamed protein product [Arctogadus glacialis]